MNSIRSGSIALLSLIIIVGLAWNFMSDDLKWFIIEDIEAVQYEPRYTIKRAPFPQSLAVILDLGHGGPDHGAAVFYNGRAMYESLIVEDVGHHLIESLVKSNDSNCGRVQIFPVRCIELSNSDSLCGADSGQFILPSDTAVPIHDDIRVSLAQRVSVIDQWYSFLHLIAPDVDQVVLVSLHVDSGPPTVGGVYGIFPGRVYDTLPADNLPALYWQSVSLGKHILSSIREAGIKLRSEENALRSYVMIGYVKYHDEDLGVRPGRIAIFRDTPAMPKLLVELGNLRHPLDASNLQESTYRIRIAEAILEGIERYACAGI